MEFTLSIFTGKVKEMNDNINKGVALLVMDVQGATVKRLKNKGSSSLLPFLAETIEAARKKNILVLYVVVGFRKNYPEVDPVNKTFNALKSSGSNFDGEEGMKIDPAVAPLENEITIVKRRVSAFSGSDLEIILRSNNIRHIVLTGIATSGVVLSTLREAADKDYRITVLEDCCEDSDDEVHKLLMAKIFPRQADVVLHTDWIEQIV